MIWMSELINKLATDIKNHELVISLPVRDVQGLLSATLEADPRLVAYIEGVHTESGMFDSKLRFRYRNQDVPIDSIVKVNSKEEYEQELHRTIRKYSNIKILLLPTALHIANYFSVFMEKYNGYYSNLIGMNCSSGSISLLPQWECVIVRFEYRIGKVKLGMMELDVQNKIKELSTSLFLPEMKQEVKAYIAHNYLARTVTYWEKDEPNALEKSYMQSAYGALINGKCVCQGYAEAYKRILDSQGITCEVICGQIKGSPVHHAWNIVSFNRGRECFHVDVTWDSESTGCKRDTYFCLSDSKLVAERTWTKSFGMTCNSSRNILQEAKSQIAANMSLYLRKGIKKEYLR